MNQHRRCFGLRDPLARRFQCAHQLNHNSLADGILFFRQISRRYLVKVRGYGELPFFVIGSRGVNVG